MFRTNPRLFRIKLLSDCPDLPNHRAASKSRRPLRLRRRDQANRHGRSPVQGRAGRGIAAASNVQHGYVRVPLGVEVLDEYLQEPDDRNVRLVAGAQWGAVVDWYRNNRVAGGDTVAITN